MKPLEKWRQVRRSNCISGGKRINWFFIPFPMITPEEEKYILKNSKVPEHIPALMVGISEAVPFLISDFFCLAKEDWLVFIGYPLEGQFSADAFSLALERAMAQIRPVHTWFIAPEIPASLAAKVRSREKDFYYRLDMKNPRFAGRLIREAEKASQELTVDPSRNFSEEHLSLTEEFLKRQELPPRVRHLYLRMKDYLSFSKTSLLLSARDRKNRLSAYYVLELGAEEFLTYVVGCHSKTNYVPHASDYLFYEMIKAAQNSRKEYIHLGLGVNEGIARFKKKWGGIPSLGYEFGEIAPEEKGLFSWIKALAGRL